MENDKISYFAHEGMMARMERMNHRLWVVIIVLIIALIATNLAWVIYESQFIEYDITTQEVTQDTDGGGSNRFVGGDYYGTSDSQNNEDKGS